MNKSLARLLSLLFHPLLALTYALLLLLLINPYAFGARSVADKRVMALLLSVFATSFLLPAFGVSLMKPLGLIKTLQMEDKIDRTGPYILAGVFYLWLYKNLLSTGQAPDLFTTCALGAIVAMLLLAMKTWGGGMFDIPIANGILQLSLNVVLAIAIVLAGLVGTARLALNAHEPKDLYRGYAAGIVAVLLASMI
jgi:hypothetical protein